MTIEYKSLGLMSGTSGDGIDASIIQSDGENSYKEIYNKYFKYNQSLFEKIHFLKEKINKSEDLNTFSKDLDLLERDITLFHATIVEEILKENNRNVDIIGFHGQTVFHSQKLKISKQLGDAKLLSQLSNKKVAYNFRERDLKNGGAGAPLASIFHKTLVKQKKLTLPVCILNIGGISNITIIKNDNINDVESRDIGPGNCLIDEWVRKNSEKNYDLNGSLASRGKVNKIILEQAQELFSNSEIKHLTSLDTKDFDVSFARGLSLEDGAALMTNFTAQIISSSLLYFLSSLSSVKCKILVCGGGRKNNFLIENIKKSVKNIFVLEPIDNYQIDGDFIESQAFAFLAIRTYLKLPISFPKTTGCLNPTTGGEIIDN